MEFKTRWIIMASTFRIVLQQHITHIYSMYVLCVLYYELRPPYYSRYYQLQHDNGEG